MEDRPWYLKDPGELNIDYSGIETGGKEYTQGLYELGVIRARDAVRYAEFLRDPKSIIPSINRAIVLLDEYRDKAVKRKDLQWAWGNLTDFLGSIKSSLQENDLYVFVYGSMVFGDPRNLDFDLLFFSDNYNEQAKEKILNEWSEKLNKEYWKPRNVGAEGHVFYLSVEELDEVLERVKSDPHYLADYPSDTEFLCGQASIVLGGRAIYTPSEVDFHKADNSEDAHNLRNKLIRRIEQNSILGATVAVELEKTLRIRKERRQ